jgi:acyl dehydratase
MDTLLKDPVLAATVNDAEFIENIIYDELDIGRSASVTRVVSQNDIDLFAAVSGDVNPAHLDTEYANASMFHGVITHGMLSGSLFSTILGTVLPGPGTIYLRQDLKFRRPVKPGDVVTATAGLFSSVSMIGGIAQSESRRGMRQGKKCLSLREDM